MRSQVSRWLGPPQRRTKMTERSAAMPRRPRLASTLAETDPRLFMARAPTPAALMPWRSWRRESLLVREGDIVFPPESGGGTSEVGWTYLEWRMRGDLSSRKGELAA